MKYNTVKEEGTLLEINFKHHCGFIRYRWTSNRGPPMLSKLDETIFQKLNLHRQVLFFSSATCDFIVFKNQNCQLKLQTLFDSFIWGFCCCIQSFIAMVYVHIYVYVTPMSFCKLLKGKIYEKLQRTMNVWVCVSTEKYSVYQLRIAYIVLKKDAIKAIFCEISFYQCLPKMGLSWKSLRDLINHF